MIALCLFGGMLSGLATPPGAWYASLQKPDWQPPPWIFGPVWTVLYIMIGVAGWMLWTRRAAPGGRLPLMLFVVQLALNFAWTPVFFGLHAMGAAFAVIAVLWLAIVANVVSAWRVRPAASMLLLPYLAWVGFAAVLNLTLWEMASR
jgi:benzodiazapine receptor